MKAIIAARIVAEAAGAALLVWLWLNDQPWAALHALAARLSGG